MENQTIASLINLGSPLITSLATIIVAFITSHSSKKTTELTNKIDKNTLNQDKRFLIQFMDKAEKGETISQEEMMVAYETKEEYNALGGDSYVDTKWERLEELNRIKIVKE